MGKSSGARLTLRRRKGSFKVARGYSRCSGTTPTAWVGTRTKRRGSVGWRRGATRRVGMREEVTPGEGILRAPPKEVMRNDCSWGGIGDGMSGDGVARVAPGACGSLDGTAAGGCCWVLPAPAISMGTLRFVALI